jgi:hypothetical protein
VRGMSAKSPMANVGHPGTIDGPDVDAAVTIRVEHECPRETQQNATGSGVLAANRCDLCRVTYRE